MFLQISHKFLRTVEEELQLWVLRKSNMDRLMYRFSFFQIKKKLQNCNRTMLHIFLYILNSTKIVITQEKLLSTKKTGEPSA